MKVGFLGLGKLGLPLAVAISSYSNHTVMGYDLHNDRMSTNQQPYKEAGPEGDGNFNDYLRESLIEFPPLETLVNESEIIFVAVQTPHGTEFDGTHVLTENRADFNYGALQSAVKSIIDTTWKMTSKDITICVMSTVLPGTLAREILPMFDGYPRIHLAYSPQFIAMGTTMYDFLHPDIILLGSMDEYANDVMLDFYAEMFDGEISKAQIHSMSIESCELAKVAYNTFIGMKICFANTIMEICAGLQRADCDDVINALVADKTRILSPRYMRGGMGDGGGCHPRDNIALSWFAQKNDITHDIFTDMMACRQNQTLFIAKLAGRLAKEYDLPICIMGYAFKPEINLTDGSPALLLQNLFARAGRTVLMRDPVINEGKDFLTDGPHVFIIGCKHAIFSRVKFPKGSVVLDPWRYISDSTNFAVYRLGEGIAG